MSSGFTNTFILEANRLSSEDVKSGNNSNNAVWTSKVNDGLRLEVGDQVGVHSAYISELGAEGSDIEIKGVNIDTLNASQIQNTTELIFTGFAGSSSGTAILRDNTGILERRVDVSKSITYRDDTINLVMSPYKNTNGEFYITLPWNYAGARDTTAEEEALWTDANPIVDYNPVTASNVFGNASTGNITRVPYPGSYNASDMRFWTPKQTTVLSDPPVTASFTVAVRHDNARFSIYQLRDLVNTVGNEYDQENVLNPVYVAKRDAALDGILWGYDDFNASIAISNASYQKGLRQDQRDRGGEASYGNSLWNDIATHPYVRVKNSVSATANTGYNSNTDVASKITEDLIRTKDITVGDDSTTAENQVNKLYDCANIGNFSYDLYKSFNQHDGQNASYLEQDTYKFISAYHTIGVKRPDLFEIGRSSFNSSGSKIAADYYINADDSALNTSGLLITDIPWNEQNLTNLKTLADAQYNYPELFAYGSVYEFDWAQGGATENLQDENGNPNSFFLHMNMKSNHDFLGYDINDNHAPYWATGAPNLNASECPTRDFATAPIFFDRNGSTNELGPDKAGGNWENAVYGFAVKVAGGLGSTYIGFQSTNHYDFGEVSPSGSGVYKSGTRLGWDHHFNAYGCPCILPWNGYAGFTGVGYQGFGVSSYVDEDRDEFLTALSYYPSEIKQLYLGSGNITMGFSSETDRFELRNLHTSEKIGNLYNAGYSGDNKYESPPNASTGAIEFVNPDLAVPVNPDASQNVYKLNKQLLKNNYTPCMTPYDSEVDGEFYTRKGTNASYTAKQRFDYFNNNFIKNNIYDSMCGSFILDWGVNEKYWDDSLLGIMGFRYKQTLGNESNQTRVINSNDWSRMKEQTTNADITNSDYENLTRNVFNTPTFLITPPIGQTPPFLLNASGFSPNASHTYLPPVSITQVNGQTLRAQDIATRTLRPYYTIRSNIIGQSQYLGGGHSGIPLPVIAVVEKVSQSGDYFNLSSSTLRFTITQPTLITDITTSICDPDGSYSSVSPNSAVLYQIEKSIKADMNPVSTILEALNKKQAQQFEQSLQPPEPSGKDIINLIAEMIIKK